MVALDKKQITPRLLHRFWSKVAKSKPDECWNWLAGLHDGYGLFRLGKHAVYSHRVAYWLVTEIDPGSSLLRHSCDNRKCCNPAHLIPGTHADNAADKVARGRNFVPDVAGEKNGNAKLTTVQVEELRQLQKTGLSIATIARRFNLPYQGIYGAIVGDKYGKNPHYTKRKGHYAGPFCACC